MLVLSKWFRMLKSGAVGLEVEEPPCRPNRSSCQLRIGLEPGNYTYSSSALAPGVCPHLPTVSSQRVDRCSSSKLDREATTSTPRAELTRPRVNRGAGVVSCDINQELQQIILLRWVKRVQFVKCSYIQILLQKDLLLGHFHRLVCSIYEHSINSILFVKDFLPDSRYTIPNVKRRLSPTTGQNGPRKFSPGVQLIDIKFLATSPAPQKFTFPLKPRSKTRLIQAKETKKQSTFRVPQKQCQRRGLGCWSQSHLNT